MECRHWSRSINKGGVAKIIPDLRVRAAWKNPLGDSLGQSPGRVDKLRVKVAHHVGEHVIPSPGGFL